MNRIGRNLTIILVIIFILLTFYAAMLLLDLPDQLLEIFDIHSPDYIERAEKAFMPLYLTLALDFVLIFFILFFLTGLAFRVRKEKVVYASETNKAFEENTTDEWANHKKVKVEGLEQMLTESSTQQSILSKVLSMLCQELEAGIGLAYQASENGVFSQKAHFAILPPENQTISFREGDGLIGQVIKGKKELILANIPDGYAKVVTGLGETSPKTLLFLPLIVANEVVSIFELGLMKTARSEEVAFAKEALQKIAFLIENQTITLQPSESKN